MADFPLITIGIACFNSNDTIERAVRSARAQTWPNMEIVIVDDGSTDGSPDILGRLAANDDRVRIYIHDINRGVAAARNTILKHARGEFIAFFDDDDESLPERLTEQVRRIQDYEEKTGADLVICHSARTQVLPDGSERYEPTTGTQNLSAAPNSLPVADRILIGRPLGEPYGSCATCSQMARKRLYDALGGFDENLKRGEDSDLDIRLALAGGHFAGIAKPLVTQYLTISSDKYIDQERRYVLLWFDKNRDYLSKMGWYEHARQWLDIKFDYLEDRKVRFLIRMLLLLLRYPFKTSLRLYWTWPNRHHSKSALKWYREHSSSDHSKE